MKRIVFGLAILFGLSTLVAAQLRVDVALVNVVATVTDDRGRYVSSLTIHDFILDEDGKRQEISHFNRSNDLPVSLGIVLDTSTSMERKLGTATRAIDRFIRDIHPEDDIFLMTFDEKPRVRQNFTNDREKLSAALYKARLGSGTSLYDALIEAVDKMKKAKHKKKAILLISDGVDTTSEHDFRVALLAIRQSEVLVYCLGVSADGSARAPQSERTPTGRPTPLPDGGTLPSTIPLPGPGRRAAPPGLPQTGRRTPNLDAVDMRILDAFANASGGNSWLIRSGGDGTREIRDALEFMADELRSQYTLGYYPGHPLKDGQWHRIEIETRNPRYHVRAKQDYFGQ